jgi:hypothetical protein
VQSKGSTRKQSELPSTTNDVDFVLAVAVLFVLVGVGVVVIVSARFVRGQNRSLPVVPFVAGLDSVRLADEVPDRFESKLPGTLNYEFITLSLLINDNR